MDSSANLTSSASESAHGALQTYQASDNRSQSAHIMLIGVITLILLGYITYGVTKNMSTAVTAAQALSDLQNAVTALGSQITALTTADQALNAAITALQASQSTGVAPADVEAVVATLQTAQTNLASVVTAITTETTSITPPPAASSAVAK